MWMAHGAASLAVTPLELDMKRNRFSFARWSRDVVRPMFALGALVAPAALANPEALGVTLRNVHFTGGGCTEGDDVRLYNGRRLAVSYGGLTARAEAPLERHSEKCKVTFELVPPDATHQIVLAPIHFCANAVVPSGDEVMLRLGYSLNGNTDPDTMHVIGRLGGEGASIDELFEVPRAFVMNEEQPESFVCGEPVRVQVSVRIDATKGQATSTAPVHATVDGAFGGIRGEAASVPCTRPVAPEAP
jgi:hypothetical protein